jgi:WD40 repeat protein
VRALIALASLAAIAPACGGGECLDGTVRHQDTCVPFDPFDRTPPVITVDPPVRTRNVGNIRLTSNEPAEIYVTTDETEPTLDSLHEPDQLVIPNDSNDIVIRFFAIDLAGNRSNEQTVLWNIDQRGPAPPNNFKLTRTDGLRSLAWVPPQNENHLGGVLIARVEGRLNAQPTSGVAYAVGDLIEPGVTVVHVTGPDPNPATFQETLPPEPGIVRYIAWAFDDLLNYGPPAGDFDLVPLGPQLGSYVINTLNGVVTQGQKPPNLTLSGSAIVGGSTITAKLTVLNETNRVIHAPKLRVRNGVTFDSDGVFEALPYKAYGAALNPGASTTVTWTFTGVTGNSLLVEVDLEDNPVLMSSNQSRSQAGSVHDFATGAALKILAAGPGDERSGFGAVAGGFTPDGRVVFGSRSSGTISSWDLQSGNRLATTELRPQSSHTPQVVLDRSGSIGYAVVCDQHLRKLRNSSGVESELVRFDVATLSDQGRLSIGLSRNRDMRMSPDGRYLVIASGNAAQGAIVVDLQTFTVARTLLGTRADAIAFTPDGRSVAVVGSEIRIFSLDDGALQNTVPLPLEGARVLRASFNGPNELWVGRRDALQKIDLLGTNPPASFCCNTRMLEVIDGKVYRGSFGTLQVLDTNGVPQPPTMSFSSQRGHWLGRSPF